MEYCLRAWRCVPGKIIFCLLFLATGIPPGIGQTRFQVSGTVRIRNHGLGFEISVIIPLSAIDSEEPPKE